MNSFFVEVMDDTMADILRKKSEVERLRFTTRRWRSARSILRGAIQSEHPDWNEEKINGEIAERISHGLVRNEIK